MEWVNDVVSVRRIIVRDIVEDFYDGQVISEFVGKGDYRIGLSVC